MYCGSDIAMADKDSTQPADDESSGTAVGQLTLDEWKALRSSDQRPARDKLPARRPGEGCSTDPRWSEMTVLRSKRLGDAVDNGTEAESGRHTAATAGQFDDAVCCLAYLPDYCSIVL